MTESRCSTCQNRCVVTHLPEDVKRVCDLYDVKVEGYYDSSFDREFEERLKDVPLLKEAADFLEKAPVHQ